MTRSKLYFSKRKLRWASVDPHTDEAIAQVYQQEKDKVSALSVLGGGALLMFLEEKLAEFR